MKAIHGLLFITIIGLTTILYPLDKIITFFLQKYPSAKTSSEMKEYGEKLKQPSYLFKNITQTYSWQPGQEGIMCIYAGNVALSNNNGQIIFPKQQQTPNIYLLITPSINIAYMIAPTTVHNLMIDRTQPAEMFFITLKHDETSQLSYYETSKTDLPKDNNIPLNTIIIISNPEDVFLPLGATIINYSPNIVLPTIFIKNTFCFVYNSLFTLAIKEYFDQIKSSYKQDNATVAHILQLT